VNGSSWTLVWSKKKSFGGSEYWLLATNNVMNFCFSKFLRTKDQMPTAMISLVHDLKNNEDIAVKKTCCNNAGDNIAFHQNAKKEGLGLNFKFMAHVAPQQNGWVEHNFAMLFRRVQLILNSAGLVGTSADLCKGWWAKCTNTATKMENTAMRNKKELPF